MGLCSQKVVRGMERAGMEQGMETGHRTGNLLGSELKGQAPRHDPLREHCPTKLHSLNKSRPFSRLDDSGHESHAWIRDIHIYIIEIIESS